MIVGFLGMGIMGQPMAARIAAAGHNVRVWNRTPGDFATAVSAGARIAASAAQAVTDADIVILMVSTGEVSDDILFGDLNIAAAIPHSACAVVMSSIPPATARHQAERLGLRGIAYIDAPVSGGEIGAREGTLTIMAGGDAANIARVEPVLTAMGHVTHVGPVGSGQIAKLANQTIVGISIAAVAEALLLAEAGGANATAVIAALRGGFADSSVLRIHGPRMASGDFQPGAHASTQLKDLTTAQQLADDAGLELPTLALVKLLFAEMCASGRDRLDHSGLYQWLKGG